MAVRQEAQRRIVLGESEGVAEGPEERGVAGEVVAARDAGKVSTWISPLEGGMPIHFGENAIDLLPALLVDLKADKVVIVSDNAVDHALLALAGVPRLVRRTSAWLVVVPGMYGPYIVVFSSR